LTSPSASGPVPVEAAPRDSPSSSTPRMITPRMTWRRAVAPRPALLPLRPDHIVPAPTRGARGVDVRHESQNLLPVPPHLIAAVKLRPGAPALSIPVAGRKAADDRVDVVRVRSRAAVDRGHSSM
jgi:hypothetical protein